MKYNKASKTAQRTYSHVFFHASQVKEPSYVRNTVDGGIMLYYRDNDFPDTSKDEGYRGALEIWPDGEVSWFIYSLKNAIDMPFYFDLEYEPSSSEIQKSIKDMLSKLDELKND